MLNISRVLYATDFSDTSRAALPSAVRIAELHGAKLEIFHAVVWQGELVTYKDALSDGLDEVEAELGRIARGKLGDLDVCAAAEVEVVRHVGYAVAAAPALLARVEQTGADLIVMATHGRRGFRRMLIGSVTEEVVRKAPCPVMTVNASRKGTTSRPAFKQIVAATDFSSGGNLAVAHAVELAATSHARLDLVHVIEPMTHPEFYYPANDSGVDDLPGLRERSSGALLELLDSEDAGRVRETRARVEVGRPSSEIGKLAREFNADLLVVGSHGRTGFRRMLLGSVAEGVLRDATCPVLVLRTDGRSLLPVGAKNRRETEAVS
jgi:nucleotide-binding universal stress UspA family protein